MVPTPSLQNHNCSPNAGTTKAVLLKLLQVWLDSAVNASADELSAANCMCTASFGVAVHPLEWQCMGKVMCRKDVGMHQWCFAETCNVGQESLKGSVTQSGKDTRQLGMSLQQ